MTYLFSVALGPAQEFIAAARRTRDLWFSSWLLSELSKAAAKAIGRDKLIFPAVASDDDLNPDSEFNVVNKILAKVEDAPQALGKRVKDAIHERLREIRVTAFADLEGAYDVEKAEAQINDLPEVYWAAVPLGDNYRKARTEVEALLAARKNTRDFISTKGWAGNLPKSSLDGLRESVICNAAALEQRGVKKAETLCGIGLLKRFGKRDTRFWSTSHIAALPLILSLNEEHQQAIATYRQMLDSLNIDESAFHCPANSPSRVFPYDGHLLFEEQLKEYFDGAQQVREARVALKQLLREIANGQTPSPYYAILHADGDRMGEAIDAQDTEDNHRQLSAALSAFAGQARDIVKQSNGSLIYAGGDDVLALVPLHTVVACARQLADEFKSKLSEFRSENNPPPTLSVGIGISHQMEPLEDALNLAREAEKEAKKIEGKNALCIKVSKRSGSVTTVKGKWGELNDRLNLFAGFHERDEVPDGAAYELRRLAEDFKDFDAAHKAEAYRKEAARILSRKRSKRSTEEIKQDVQKNLLHRLSTDRQKPEDAMRALADELIVAKLFVNPFKSKGDTK
jgi:CRISPR-associated protein Cmr2